MIKVTPQARLTRLQHVGVAVTLSMLLIGFGIGFCVAQAAGWGRTP